MSRLEKIKSKQATIGIVGLGYVGLPLARAFCRQAIHVVGFDIDQEKIDLIENDQSYIKHIGDDAIKEMRAGGLFNVTTDFAKIANVDVIIICVPTPLSKHREPDLGPVLNTGKSIMPHLQKGQLVILESSTYPGTTDTELANVLEQSGLKKDEDFFLAYSPGAKTGNESFPTSTIPKIVGADTPQAREMVAAVYEGVISQIVPVASSRTTRPSG